jgi:hypothetical protein
VILNAEVLGDVSSREVGSTLFYRCRDNFIASGEGIFTCKETENGFSWIGQTLVCKPGKSNAGE